MAIHKNDDGVALCGRDFRPDDLTDEWPDIDCWECRSIAPEEIERDQTVRFQRLLDKGDPGDWIGVFEGADLSDRRTLGLRFGMLFDGSDWDAAELGKTCAPDTRMGLGWRFLLKAKCRTANEAAKAMQHEAV